MYIYIFIFLHVCAKNFNIWIDIIIMTRLMPLSRVIDCGLLWKSAKHLPDVKSDKLT